MSRTFGKRIEQFVMSSDIMDDDIFKDLMELIQRYLERDLSVTHFALLMEGFVNNKPGLETKWCMTDARSAYSMPENESGKYENHSTYAFGKDTPLWVVAESREPLKNSENWKDLWSKNTDIPIDEGIQGEIRTSIRHPVKRDGLAVGVLEIASSRYIEPAPVSRNEIEMLAGVIDRAFNKVYVRNKQHDNIKVVLKTLYDMLDKEIWTRLALPKMFVAFSGGTGLEGEVKKAHESVIETIREVVEKFRGALEAVFWDKIEESGNITEQMIREISLSEYGICYFSEPAGDGQYSDNPNVLFEAGMMQALQKSPAAPMAGWIPIREKASPPLPFDIATERILQVDRDEKGALKNLALNLNERLEKLLEGDDAA